MELELKFAELACCEPVGDLITTQEESMETAIPEYCPDIARIVDTVGQLRLREKHPAGQQLTMGGSVVLTVLYTSEESAGLRSLSMEVPFSCQVEDKRLADCDAVCVTGRLLLAEAKAVTARKLYLRVMPEFTVSGYARRRQRLCCGTEEDPALPAAGAGPPPGPPAGSGPPGAHSTGQERGRLPPGRRYPPPPGRIFPPRRYTFPGTRRQ